MNKESKNIFILTIAVFEAACNLLWLATVVGYHTLKGKVTNYNR